MSHKSGFILLYYNIYTHITRMPTRKLDVELHIELFRVLHKSPDSKLKELLKHLENKKIKYICEIIYNIKKGNLELDKPEIRKGKVHSELYEKIAKKRGSTFPEKIEILINNPKFVKLNLKLFLKYFDL